MPAIKRDIEKDLLSWKNQKDRYPLIIRGARQVGKSYIIEQFAKTNFGRTVIANFEFRPQLKECFTSVDPTEIINKLQMVLEVEIDEENTLLFLDEIQDCPQAILALRYFREKMPKLAVVGAGSLLELTLRSEEFRMPVGRVQFLYLKPVSFSEFLEATGNQQLKQALMGLELSKPTDEDIHRRAIEQLRKYLILGGMPAILKDYIANNDMSHCETLQSSLLQTYRSDFGKYAKVSQHKYLQKIFDIVPRFVGQRIIYSHIDPVMKSRDLKNAVDLLSLAEIIKPIYHTKASGIPLGAQINEKKLKINYLDVGLMQNSCGLQSNLASEEDIVQINAGGVAEQFVGQELLAYSEKNKVGDLFFWAREKRSSTAEVDFIINIGSDIIPLEVKSGSGRKLKSVRLFLKEKKTKYGIRISQNKLSYIDGILSIPLYLIEQLPRLVKSVIE